MPNDEKTQGKSTEPVHGTDAQGREVTAAFGQEGTRTEDHTFLSDGHKSKDDFWGSKGAEGHDHYDGKGNGTDRGQYNGEGSKEE